MLDKDNCGTQRHEGPSFVCAWMESLDTNENGNENNTGNNNNKNQQTLMRAFPISHGFTCCKTAGMECCAGLGHAKQNTIVPKHSHGRGLDHKCTSLPNQPWLRPLRCCVNI
eukprot:1151484-Pelagomonas_calceolata.AAC.9